MINIKKPNKSVPLSISLTQKEIEILKQRCNGISVSAYVKYTINKYITENEGL
jgi:hypothetical protein